MTKFYDPENPVPHDEQNREAWLAVLAEMRNFMVAMLILVLSGVSSFHTARWVMLNGYGNWFFAVLAATVFTVLSGVILYARKEGIRREIFGRPDPWYKNRGELPRDCERVSVEFRDGSKRWNVPANELIWSFHEENPIMTFFPKK
jgi:hypothetical protein